MLEKVESRVDAQLFAIKNLLMLREQLAIFDANFTSRSSSFNFNQAVTSIRQSSWMQGLLQVGSSLISPAHGPEEDVKKMVDIDLKQTCEDFILETSKKCTEPLGSFLLKTAAFIQTRRGDLKSQSFASPLIVEGLYQEFLKRVDELAVTMNKLSSYIGDKSTQGILIRIIRVYYSNLGTYHGAISNIFRAYPT